MESFFSIFPAFSLDVGNEALIDDPTESVLQFTTSIEKYIQ